MAYSDEGSVGPDWEDILDGVDLPLVVDMSHWIGCITRLVTYTVTYANYGGKAVNLKT